MRSLLPVLAVTALVCACQKSSLDRPSSTITYSAKHQSRTVDSTGFVDNTGSTSDQTNRTEMSGMRATETGSERPTATAGSGTPIPIEATGEGEGPLGGEDNEATGLPGDSLVGRMARARCDRETACNRVGEGKRFATGEQCTNGLRERARADVVAAQCARGFESTQVALCLTSMRQIPCDAELVRADSLPACQSTTLCSP